MKNKLLSGTGLLIIAILVLAANLLCVVLFSRAKVDLTEEKLFTLSPGSVKITKDLPEGVRAELYCSRTALANIPPLKNYADRVTEMLREYEDVSGDKLKLEVLEPRPDTELEETAESEGLQGISGDGSGERIYLGLVLISESGPKATIPFFDPRKEDSLEYDISKAIYNVSHPERKKIGVMSSIDVTGEPANPYMQQQQRSKPWAFIKGLKNTFQVSKLEASATEIPKDLDLLLLIHPKTLSAPTLYAIDQYLLNGGKLAVFVDPFSHADKATNPMGSNPQMAMQASYNSNIPDLFKAWGVELQIAEGASANPMMQQGGETSLGVVEDPNIATKVSGADGSAQDMIIWLSLHEANCNKNEIITSQLKEVVLGAAGSLKKVATKSGLTYTSLMGTTDKAGLTTDMMLKFGATDPGLMRNEYKSGGTKLDLAMKISGKFKTAFPDGKPPAAPSPESKEPVPTGPTPDPNQLKEGKKESTVIIVTDVDFMSDDFSVQSLPFFGGQDAYVPRNSNLDFVYNIAENLTNTQDLISLRSRGRSQRPFTRIVELERKATDKWMAEEKSLQKDLDDANQRLSQLQQGQEGKERRVLDQAYMAEVEKFRKAKVETQKKLRLVRRHLREDIESLQSRLMAINIALVPLAVALFGAFVALRKTVSRREES